MNGYVRKLKIIVRGIDEHPLASRHKLRAYLNVIRWQLKCALGNNDKKVRFTDKTFLMVKKGMVGATGNIYMGLHEFNEMGFLLHFLKKEDFFLDIGANIGSYTVLASGHIGSHTIAFEPVPSTFKTLEKNVWINEVKDKVKLFQKGVDSENRILNFSSNLDSVNHVMVDNHEASLSNVIEVGVVAIDDILNADEIPSLVKIDVEGFETKVLMGMKQTLKNDQVKAIIIELNGSGWRYGYDEKEIHQSLVQLGFSPFSYNPFDRELCLLKTFGQNNTIYLRDVNTVKERILDSKKISMFLESF